MFEAPSLVFLNPLYAGIPPEPPFFPFTGAFHSIFDGGAKIEETFPSYIVKREEKSKIKSHTKEDFFFAPFYYSFILLFPASFLFFFVGLVIKPHV